MNKARDTYSVNYLTSGGRKRSATTYRDRAGAECLALAFQRQGLSAQVVLNHHLSDGRSGHTVIGIYNVPGMPAFAAEVVKG